MHHEKSPALLPEPAFQGEGLPPLSMEQIQALARLAQAMTSAGEQPQLTSLQTPGVLALPGQLQVMGISSLHSLIDEFIENLVARGRKEGTLDNYRRALQRLAEVCVELPVTPAHVRQAITKPTWGQNTRHLIFVHIRAFFNELERLYGCPNPCRMIGKVEKGQSKRRVLSLEEMEAVYVAAGAEPPKTYLRKFRERNEVIVLLMIESGPRVREISNIRPWDISDGWVCLDGKTGPRWVPVSRDLTDRMKALASAYVVFANLKGKPMNHKQVNYLVKGLLAEAGVTGPYMGVHVMRHSFATNYLRNGGGAFQLQDIMGHKSLETTRRYVRLAGVAVKMDHSKASLAKAMSLVKA